MKRPQGFDAPTPPPATVAKPAPRQNTVTQPVRKPTKPPTAAAAPKPPVRKLKRERKAFERNEVRRFTRRSRSRRRLVVGAILVVAALVTTLGVAIFSPLLQLQTITITGATQVSPTELQDALSDQVGKPLALVDFDQVTRELARFPLIRSYTTQSVPPHQLIVSIVERSPVGLVADGSSFAVVDPAGIVLSSQSDRPAGLPLIDAGEASIGNPAFESAVAVLLALPADLLARVDTITATTKDDVGFVFAGGAQSVRWGSDDRSSLKARVLAGLIANLGATAAFDYDVSAPDAPVVRAR